MSVVTEDPDAAERMLACGEFGAAADAAASVLLVDPTNPRMLCVMALAERGQGRPVDAMRNCSDALKADPRYAWAYSVRSLLYLEANCVIEAERDAARACQLDPHWAEPRLLRGRALARMRRYSEAKMAVHQALAIDPGIGGARELLGLIHAAQSDDEAEQKLVMNASASFVSRVTTPFGYTQKQRRGAAVTSLLIGVLAIVIQVAIVRRYGVVHTTNAALWLAVLVAVAFASKINRRPPS